MIGITPSIWEVRLGWSWEQESSTHIFASHVTMRSHGGKYMHICLGKWLRRGQAATGTSTLSCVKGARERSVHSRVRDTCQNIDTSNCRAQIRCLWIIYKGWRKVHVRGTTNTIPSDVRGATKPSFLESLRRTLFETSAWLKPCGENSNSTS